jgi:hypothetical protein
MSKYEAEYWQTVDEKGNALEDPALERTVVVENWSMFLITEKTDLDVEVADGSKISLGKSIADPDEDAISEAGDAVVDGIGAAVSAGATTVID